MAWLSEGDVIVKIVVRWTCATFVPLLSTTAIVVLELLVSASAIAALVLLTALAVALLRRALLFERELQIDTLVPVVILVDPRAYPELASVVGFALSRVRRVFLVALALVFPDTSRHAVVVFLSAATAAIASSHDESPLSLLPRFAVGGSTSAAT